MSNECAGHGTKRVGCQTRHPVYAEPKARSRARASPRGGVWRKSKATSRGEASMRINRFNSDAGYAPAGSAERATAESSWRGETGPQPCSQAGSSCRWSRSERLHPGARGACWPAARTVRDDTLSMRWWSDCPFQQGSSFGTRWTWCSGTRPADAVAGGWAPPRRMARWFSTWLHGRSQRFCSDWDRLPFCA